MRNKWHKKISRNKFHAKQMQEGALCEVCLLKGLALQFHHRNAHDKIKDISSLIGKRTTLTKLKREIAKCDLVCNECHKGVHQWWAAFDTIKGFSILGNFRVLYYALSRYTEWKA